MYFKRIEMQGFKSFADPVNIELNDGYLTITASKGLNEEEKNNKGKIVRQERYSGTMQRTFYVGEQLTHEDIKAKYEDGVLSLDIPKKEEKKLPEKHTIMIEG